MVGGGKGGLVVLTWRRETHKERGFFFFCESREKEMWRMKRNLK